ncbi:CorA family divalent cation transporter [Solimonas soli]|uniref:CorA family divalent cation transporter n=1 Tax=Solimonas soli TaxID=413479 RepID=UPI0004B5EB72|nr:CorA family divalent cation transporter [Solimonas soli]
MRRLGDVAGEAAPGAFRWLHFNEADRGALRWVQTAQLPPAIADVLLSQDRHQRAVVEGAYVACVLHDFEREFEDCETRGIGALRFVIGPHCIASFRRHPLRCADIVRRRLMGGARIGDAAGAFSLLAGALTEVVAAQLHELDAAAEQAEDALLADEHEPDTRQLALMRRRAVQLHRLLSGLRSLCARLEADDALPPALLPPVETFAQRIAALDQGVIALQSQLRLLRDELELQTSQRTNRSLYILSIVSALMLPATFVTGLFGMNTGGLPWAEAPHGTLVATLLALGSAGAVYLVLRLLGFIRL